MKIERTLLVVYLTCLLFIALTLFTPLEFSHKRVKITTYSTTLILTFAEAWLFARKFKNKIARRALRSTPFALVGVFIIISLVNPFIGLGIIFEIPDTWETCSIYYRLKADTNVYVAFQMKPCFIHFCVRTVKVRPLSPLFNWITPIDETKIESDKHWIKVHEEYNPYNLKF